MRAVSVGVGFSDSDVASWLMASWTSVDKSGIRAVPCFMFEQQPVLRGRQLVHGLFDVLLI